MTRRAAREAARGRAPEAASGTPVPAADGAATELIAAGSDGQPAADATPARRGGLAALLRAHPVAWSVGAGALVFALLGTGSVFAGVAWASRDTASAPASPGATEDPARPLPAALGDPARLRTCSVAGQAADGRLVSLAGSVMRADTGEVLFDRGGATPAAPASVLKVFTSAAAVARLGPDFQVTTSVYEGSTPGTIVLVGRGDATLSALPVGQESYYPGAPKLQTLAENTVAQYRAKYPDTPITKVVLDASYWNPADRWDDSWDRGEQTRGYQSEVTALQVDGDRADPRAATSARSTDPIGRAGAAFLAALRDADPDGEVVDADISTTTGTAVGSTTLAEVKSQPIRTWISQLLLDSDNTLAEMLARIVSRESDMGGSASSLQQAIPAALMTWEVPSAGLVIRDGSGLSGNNAVPPQVMADFLRQVAAGTAGLDVARAGLPVAGKSGSLADRFSGDNADARGNVTAKSGTLSNASTLAGYLTATDGTQLTFAFSASGDGLKTSDARAAIDTLTAAVMRCGDNLSTN